MKNTRRGARGHGNECPRKENRCGRAAAQGVQGGGACRHPRHKGKIILKGGNSQGGSPCSREVALRGSAVGTSRGDQPTKGQRDEHPVERPPQPPKSVLCGHDGEPEGRDHHHSPTNAAQHAFWGINERQCLIDCHMGFSKGLE